MQRHCQNTLVPYAQNNWHHQHNQQAKLFSFATLAFILLLNSCSCFVELQKPFLSKSSINVKQHNF